MPGSQTTGRTRNGAFREAGPDILRNTTAWRWPPVPQGRERSCCFPWGRGASRRLGAQRPGPPGEAPLAQDLTGPSSCCITLPKCPQIFLVPSSPGMSSQRLTWPPLGTPKARGRGSRPCSPLSCCVTSGGSLPLSELQFPPLSSEWCGLEPLRDTVGVDLMTEPWGYQCP